MKPPDRWRCTGTSLPLPLPGGELRVVETSGHVLPAGQTGDLQVRGPNVFQGYWRMPERTREDFTDDGLFNTVDKAIISADGYVSVFGRSKDMIICGGLNVYPKEIEEIPDGMAGLVETAVIGVPHADFGEAVVAVVVPVPGARSTSAVSSSSVSRCRPISRCPNGFSWWLNCRAMPWVKFRRTCCASVMRTALTDRRSGRPNRAPASLAGRW